jgi:quercetin dioxygenase-like cupin family protein
MTLEHWDVEREGPLSEAALRRKMESLGYAVSRWVYPPGTVFDFHSHEVDKLDAVLSGRFRLCVPAGALHRAEVVGDEPVVSLDGVKR